MRPEPLTPADRLFELLAHADTLAGLAGAAIASGDDDRVGEILAARTALVGAVAEAWNAAQAARPTPVLLTRMREAVLESVRAGDAVQRAGRQTRDEVAAALAQIDARRQAGHEYQAGQPQGTFDVVL